jgi:electron transfer flavoprotein-quinone oxidoreductase
MMPKLATAGMLIAGDAAAMCLATGIWLEGVNFAIGSGAAAGETAVEALAAADTSERGLAGYRRRLESSFVLADHKRLRRAHRLVLSDRVQRQYPEFVCNLLEQVFTVANPQPKPGLLRLARREARRSGLRLRDLARDAAESLRSFG